MQAAGLAGHLQLFWDDVADSEFIGGKHDTPDHNHERFAYWLNGMVTIGHLNQDAALSATVYNYTSYLLDHQRDDGWLGPSQNYDPWPRMLLLYVFQQYNEINQNRHTHYTRHVQVSHVPMEAVQRPKVQPADQHVDIRAY